MIKELAVEQANDPPTHEEDEFLNLTKAGEMLGKSHTTMRDWCESGLIEYIRMPSGRFNIRRSVIINILRGSSG